MYFRTVFLRCSKEIIVSLDAVRDQTLNRKCLIELLKKQKFIKIICPERIWSFDQRKAFCENYEPIVVFAYKITENYCRLRQFAEFIQIQEVPYLSWLNKYFNWKTICISSQNFSCELNSSKTCFLWHISYLSLRL